MFGVSADNSTCVNRTPQWRWLKTQKFSNANAIDLQKKKETARVSMGKMVKHLLKKFKYPPGRKKFAFAKQRKPQWGF